MAEPASGVQAQAEVRLWGRTVGGVVELEGGRILFEYAEDFRGAGLEISPLRLPTARRGPQSFDELRRKPAFEGLPGVLSDALPDTFGNRVIRAWFAARGREDLALSPVQRLLYVGERALGALTFHPALEGVRSPAEEEALELAALVRDARSILAGAAEVRVPEIYSLGASAGGMRPKALVLWDRASGRLRSGHAAPAPGEAACILKFDGVGDGAGDRAGADELGAPQPFNRIEATYMQLAREAGLDVAEALLLEDGAHGHLLVRRFDLESGRRLHQHTFGGLVHVDYNEPGAASYEEFLRAILTLGLAQRDVEEGFRRMVFNVLAVNQDDHVKNLSFQMDEHGAWRLAPAYDLCFAKGQGFTREHQMRVADKTRDITLEDLLRTAATFGIKRPRRFLDAVTEALALFDARAAANGVRDGDRAAVQAELDLRRKSLGL